VDPELTSDHDPASQVEEDRRERLRLAFTGAGCSDLLPLLDAASGAIVGGAYRLDGLLAAGGQFFVWTATELATGRPAVLKQARFDYRHPIQYGQAEAARRREAVHRERDVLWADRSGTLPRPLAQLWGDSPVPAAAAAPALARNEVFVAEEYVHGLTLSELALRVWPACQPDVREAAAARIAAAFVAFWEGLHAAGWHYGDLSADNLLVEAPGKLRVVDGGSAVPAAAEVTLAGFTPAFTTPQLYAAATAGRPVPGSLGAVLPLLGKVLHFALTRREPFNGRLPDLDEPSLQEYSSLTRLVLELLLEVDSRPDRAEEARQALAQWAKVAQ
jgi:serine/threonine protein kinase